MVPLTLISEKLSIGDTIESIDITIHYTGSINFEISADADAGSPTWDSLTLVSGTKLIHTFTTQGSVLQFRVIGNTGARISTQINDDESFSAPGITIKINYA